MTKQDSYLLDQAICLMCEGGKLHLLNTYYQITIFRDLGFGVVGVGGWWRLGGDGGGPGTQITENVCFIRVLLSS